MRAKLHLLGASCAAGDYRSATKTVSDLAALDWDNTKDWMKGIRFLVTLAFVKSVSTAFARPLRRSAPKPPFLPLNRVLGSGDDLVSDLRAHVLYGYKFQVVF